jgi:hypothetical protein
MLHELGARDAEHIVAMRVLLHGIKETMLQCSAAAENFCGAVREQEVGLETSNFRKAKGHTNALDAFPLVRDIDGKATAFLISARRLITEVCQVPLIFWKDMRAHSSLEHLIQKEIEPKLGSEHALVKFLNGYVPGTKRLIELRNGQEHNHTTKGRHLEVHNFEHVPNGQIRQPVWYLDGDEPEDVRAMMNAVPPFLLDLAEGMFVGVLHANLPEWPPYTIVCDEQPNPECPVRYRLMIDPSRLELREPV